MMGEDSLWGRKHIPMDSAFWECIGSGKAWEEIR